MADIAGQIGATGGFGGLLSFIIIYLVKSNRDDRMQYREAFTVAETACQEAIAALQGRTDRLEAALDAERERRRDVEDVLHGEGSDDTGPGGAPRPPT